MVVASARHSAPRHPIRWKGAASAWANHTEPKACGSPRPRSTKPLINEAIKLPVLFYRLDWSSRRVMGAALRSGTISSELSAPVVSSPDLRAIAPFPWLAGLYRLLRRQCCCRQRHLPILLLLRCAETASVLSGRYSVAGSGRLGAGGRARPGCESRTPASRSMRRGGLNTGSECSVCGQLNKRLATPRRHRS